MTDDNTDVLTEDAPPEAAPTEEVPTEAVPTPAPPFWQRPHVERYLLPLVLPIVVVLGLVVFVLNLSRVFLSAHGNIAVTVGSVLTVAILLGATVLSNAARLRSSSIALMTALFILVIFSSGWLVLGHSQEKHEGGAPLAATGASIGKLEFTALASLKFAPVSRTVKTGIYSITLTNAQTGQHTLDFDDASTLFAGVEVNAGGEKATSRAFFGEPGEYTFFCAITGHRAQGMQGVIKVTGPPMTLAEAEAAAAGKP